jgi:uncharacterized protein YjbI with pentapeptide repeats
VPQGPIGKFCANPPSALLSQIGNLRPIGLLGAFLSGAFLSGAFLSGAFLSGALLNALNCQRNLISGPDFNRTVKFLGQRFPESAPIGLNPMEEQRPDRADVQPIGQMFSRSGRCSADRADVTIC